MGTWGTRRPYRISQRSSPTRRNRSRISMSCSGIRSRPRRCRARMPSSTNGCSTRARAEVHRHCRPPNWCGTAGWSTRSTPTSCWSTGRVSGRASGCRSCACTSPTSPNGSPTGYDLVQCVLGVHTFADVEADTRRLIERARPGGRVAITLWARGALEPLPELLAAAAPDDDGDPVAVVSPTIELADTAGTLAHWLTELGLVDVRAESVQRHLDLTPDLAWSLVLGTGPAPRSRASTTRSSTACAGDSSSPSPSATCVGRVTTLIAVGRRPVARRMAERWHRRRRSPPPAGSAPSTPAGRRRGRTQPGSPPVATGRPSSFDHWLHEPA